MEKQPEQIQANKVVLVCVCLFGIVGIGLDQSGFSIIDSLKINGGNTFE